MTFEKPQLPLFVQCGGRGSGTRDTDAAHSSYAATMGTRPQVIGQALTDSPAGLAAFMYDYNDGEPERLLAKDDFLDDVTLYWLMSGRDLWAR
jgi:hypothetical protein